MINETVFHRLGHFPLEKMSLEKFWANVTPKSHLYVRTQTEMDYFKGMQLIEGKPFLVFMESEEHDQAAGHINGLRFKNRYYTNDPLDRS